jgi:hypothetical protein
MRRIPTLKELVAQITPENRYGENIEGQSPQAARKRQSAPFRQAAYASRLVVGKQPRLCLFCHLERSMPKSEANRHAQSKDPYAPALPAISWSSPRIARVEPGAPPFVL